MDEDANDGHGGPDDSGDAKPAATKPAELTARAKGDPDQTGGDEPESGAGYGNHAMPDLPAASD